MKLSTFAAINVMAGAIALTSAFAQPAQTAFRLVPNPAFANCLGVPGGPAPSATVTVLRGKCE